MPTKQDNRKPASTVPTIGLCPWQMTTTKWSRSRWLGRSPFPRLVSSQVCKAHWTQGKTKMILPYYWFSYGILEWYCDALLGVEFCALIHTTICSSTPAKCWTISKTLTNVNVYQNARRRRPCVERMREIRQKPSTIYYREDHVLLEAHIYVPPE